MVRGCIEWSSSDKRLVSINISFNYLFALNALFGLSFYTKTTGAQPVVFV